MTKWLKLSGNGAIWLLLATLLSKLIGVLQKIPLQNVGGDAVFGIYNMLYPLYQLMLVLAVTGIPTAISATIARAEEQDRSIILRASNTLMLIIGLILGVILYSFSSQIANIAGSEQLTDMIKLIALTLCIAPLVASLRGYYQGIRYASISSISQLIEQLIRVGIMVVVLYMGVHAQWTDIKLATYVMWGGVAGVLAALVYLMYVRQKETRYKLVKAGSRPYRFYIHTIFITSLPAALAAVIVPLIAVIDTFTIPYLLRHTFSFVQLAEQFGLYSRIQPLVQLVTMLLAAGIAGALPSLIQTREKAYSEQLQSKRLTLLMSYTIIIGSAATVGLYFLAEPITIMLYTDSQAVEWFQLLSFMSLPASILAVSTPLFLLQKRFGVLAVLVITALTCKLFFNATLVSHTLSMLGAVYATLIALYITAVIALVAFGLNNRDACIHKDNVKKIVKAGLALVAMTSFLAAARIVSEGLLGVDLSNRLAVALYVSMLVLLGAGLFISILTKLKVVSKQDIKGILN